MTDNYCITLISAAINARQNLIDDKHETAFRLFNGFYEGYPTLVIDIFAATAVIHDYTKEPAEGSNPDVLAVQKLLIERLPWIQTIIVKVRNSKITAEKNGIFLLGSRCNRKVKEHGVWYAIDLRLNRDTSMYLDTRNLRRWAIDNLGGKTVINTFAYTGTLGVAAMAGGALQVIHIDSNRSFLNIAKDSYSLNTFPVKKADFRTGDFWALVKSLNKEKTLFDGVILDPPFFAESRSGKIDLAKHSTALINKVRPLIKDGGILIAINNALFVSGIDYMESLTQLCADGYLSVETVIPVPEDITGYAGTIKGKPPIDPAPFNHSTKIAVLRVKRK
ncbi:MAG: class I SAM-dependent methyltransferase [Candidatus Margulisiibacteriota bacterium]